MCNTVVAFSIRDESEMTIIPCKTAGSEITRTAYSLKAFAASLDRTNAIKLLTALSCSHQVNKQLKSQITLVYFEEVMSRFKSFFAV